MALLTLVNDPSSHRKVYILETEEIGPVFHVNDPLSMISLIGKICFQYRNAPVTIQSKVGSVINVSNTIPICNNSWGVPRIRSNWTGGGRGGGGNLKMGDLVLFMGSRGAWLTGRFYISMSDMVHQ